MTTQYFVPNVGPTVKMGSNAEAWAVRIGAKVEYREFTDYETAKEFAVRIESKVTDQRGKKVYYDPATGEENVE